MINRGDSPIIEDEIDDIIKSMVNKGRLQATLDPKEAVRESDLSMVCVGTPSQLNGDIDTRYVRRVCEQIGTAIKEKGSRHVVVIRSTILPGTIKNIVIPTLETNSEKQVGPDIGVCNNPEFLREGTAVYDFYNPPKTVIGEIDKKSGDLLASIYENLNEPVIRTSIEISRSEERRVGKECRR